MLRAAGLGAQGAGGTHKQGTAALRGTADV